MEEASPDIQGKSIYRQKLMACNLMVECGIVLGVKQVTIATAQIIFHRLYKSVSFDFCPEDEAVMACLFIACKTEEDKRSLDNIVSVYSQIAKSFHSHRFSSSQLQNYDQIIEWSCFVADTEFLILDHLGYHTYTEHPHRYILYFIKVLEGSDKLAQKSWNIVNDLYVLDFPIVLTSLERQRTDICLRYSAESVAVAAIYLSAILLRVPLPMRSRPWFELFDVKSDTVFNICKEICSLYCTSAHIPRSY